MEEAKPFKIPKQAVKLAFDRVKANRGAYGIDEQSISDFEVNLKDNLYKIWNRMSSGTYFPKPVKAVAIPKKNGGTRTLGIPTVEDRVAQMVAKIFFEPKVEKIFYENSYGYRPNKSAIQAVGVLRERCWERDWVVDFDIKGLFDNIRHDYLIEMVERHTEEKWISLYVERWLKTPFKRQDGTTVERKTGTPQGGVISPVLANLFMHYAFDDFMSKEFPNIPWVRYADDGCLNCVSLRQAKYIVKILDKRFKTFGIELNLDKTKIVYCKDNARKGTYENTSFDFLGYTFRPRRVRGEKGKIFVGFVPAMSDKAQKAIRKEIKSWRIQRKTCTTIKELAKMYNSKLQGWINYYTHYYKSAIYGVLKYFNKCLIKWVKRKYKNRNSYKKATTWLKHIWERNKELFAHWKFGIDAMAG